MENQNSSKYKDKKVLVVEDEMSLAQALELKLKQLGIQPLNASNGEEGLKTALLNTPDLIILDLSMPVMDGMTMLRQLRDNDWGKYVHVIILTNSSDNDKIAEGMQLNADNYLTKANTKLDDIIELVKQKLENGK